MTFPAHILPGEYIFHSSPVLCQALPDPSCTTTYCRNHFGFGRSLRRVELWMHRPWAHSEMICQYFKDGRLTDASLAERLKGKMAAAHALEELANERSIPLREPFQGDQIGEFYVLSPSKDWYVHELIAAFGKSPEKKQAASSNAGDPFWASLVETAMAGARRAERSYGSRMSEASAFMPIPLLARKREEARPNSIQVLRPCRGDGGSSALLSE
jgi:hypothetical protein